MEFPKATTVVTEWKALSDHAKTCEACAHFVRGVIMTGKYTAAAAEQCCETGTTLILVWRGAIEDLRRGWARPTGGEPEGKKARPGVGTTRHPGRPPPQLTGRRNSSPFMAP